MEIPPLARRLEEKGVRLERPRWYSFVYESYTPASPEEVERRLRDGDPLRAHVPGAEIPLPVRSREDLEELAHFQTGEPAVLARPEVARNLEGLAGQGWQFSDPDGRQVGLYAAYNAATDPEFAVQVHARKDKRSIPLDSAERANGLAAFYVLKPNEEARAEEAGYRFFNANGLAEPAFLLGEGGQVGKEQPWVDRGSDLTRRLSEFELLRERVGGDLGLARAVHRLDRLDLPSVQQLLQERTPAERLQLAPVVLEKLSPGELLAMGSAEFGVEKEVLARLAALPETATPAVVCQRVLAAAATRESRRAIFRAFAQDPESTDVHAFGARLYDTGLSSSDQDSVAKALLAELPPSPLGELQGERNLDFEARGRVTHPNARTPAELGKLASECIPWSNQEAHRQIFQQLGGFKAEAAARIHEQVEDPVTRWAIWKAWAVAPAGEGEAALTALAKDARALLTDQTYARKTTDQAKLTRALNAELGRLGVARAALDAQQRWGVADTDLAANALAENASTPLGELAAASINWDNPDAQRKALADAGAPVARELFEKVQTPVLHWAVFKAGVLNPKGDARTVGREAYKLLDDLVGVSIDKADLERLGAALVQELRDLPEAEAARRWGLTAGDSLARGLTSGKSSPGELAAECIPWQDEKAHRLVLNELKTTHASAVLAEQAHDAVQTPEMRWAIWKGYVLNPSGSAADLADGMLTQLDTVPNLTIAGKEQEFARLYAVLRDELPAAKILDRWGVSGGELALRGAAENPNPSTSRERGALAAGSISWSDEAAHRKVLSEFADDKSTRFMAMLANRIHDQVQRPETRWAVWKACVVAPDSNDVAAYKKRILELLDTVPRYTGRAEDIALLTGQLLSEIEVRALAEGMKASSDGLSVEEDRVLVGGVVLRNRRGADPAGATDSSRRYPSMATRTGLAPTSVSTEGSIPTR